MRNVTPSKQPSGSGFILPCEWTEGRKMTLRNLKSYCRRDPTSTASCLQWSLRVSHYTAHPLWALGCQSRWGSAVEKEREGLVHDGWIRPTAAPLLSLTELVTFQPGNYHCRRRNSLINYQCQRCLCFTVRGHHAKRAFALKQKPLKNERGSRSTDDAEEKHTHTHTWSALS